MARKLSDWRESFTLTQAKQACRKVTNAYSCSVLCSGGCLDTLAAIRSGFVPIWGTEIDPVMKTMWSDLTGTKCLGDTFAVDYSQQRRPSCLFSGQPCPDFSLSGGKKGVGGSTGWQYVAQCDVILKLQSHSFVLEMVANVMEIDNGSAVGAIYDKLSPAYHIHAKILRVASAGDPSNRTRLFVIGFLKNSVGDIGCQFDWPVPEFDSGHYYCARDVAVPDDQVPSEYWLDDSPTSFWNQDVHPLQIQVLASCGPGMGHSSKPHKFQGWEGIFPTQTTHNGGGRRVPLDWVPGQPIT